jgi:hypothetical protein
MSEDQKLALLQLLQQSVKPVDGPPTETKPHPKLNPEPLIQSKTINKSENEVDITNEREFYEADHGLHERNDYLIGSPNQGK